MKKFFQLAVGLAFASFFIWLILKHIDPAVVWAALQSANLSWIAAGLVAFFVGYSCRVERWRIMLHGDNPAIAWHDCAGPLFLSVAANNVLPFRAGDIVRSFAFNRKLRISTGASLATLVIERLLDLVMILIFLGTAVLTFGRDFNGSLGYVAVAPIAGAVVLFVLLLLPRSFERLAAPGLYLARKVWPSLAVRLDEQMHKVVQTLEHIGGRSTIGRLVAMSLLAWTFEGLVFFCAAQALPLIVQPVAAWLAMPVGTLATVMPSTPGFVGTFDYFIIWTMKQFGNTDDAAAAFAVLVHVLLWLPPNIVGGVYLLLHPLKAH